MLRGSCGADPLQPIKLCADIRFPPTKLDRSNRCALRIPNSPIAESATRRGGSEYRGDKLTDFSNGLVEFEGEAYQVYSFQIAVLL